MTTRPLPSPARTNHERLFATRLDSDGVSKIRVVKQMAYDSYEPGTREGRAEFQRYLERLSPKQLAAAHDMLADARRRRGGRDSNAENFHDVENPDGSLSGRIVEGPSETKVAGRQEGVGKDDDFEGESAYERLLKMEPDAVYDGLVTSGKLTSDEAREFVDKFHTTGFVPRSAMGRGTENTGAAIGRRDPWRGPDQGIDENPRHLRTGEMHTGAESRRLAQKNAQRLNDTTWRDKLLSFACGPSRSMPSIAADASGLTQAAVDDFNKRFPNAARITT